MKLLFTFLLLIFISGSISAQIKEKSKVEEEKIDQEAADAQQKTMLQKFKEVNDKVYNVMTKIPAPIVSYSTETSWLFGLAKFNAFSLKKADTISKASSVGGTIGASLSGQLFLHLGSKLYWNENKNVASIEFGLERFPRAFWGVGNDINADTSILVTKSFLNFDLEYKRMVWKNLYVGPSYHFLNVYDVSYDLDSLQKPEAYSGYDGGLNSGFGLTFTFDTRDNVYNSTSGIYASFGSEFYSPIFGSKFVFNRYILDLRTFHTVGKFVFAYQVFTESNYGNVPAYSLSLMGGTDRMRGYFSGQYRDKNIIDTQFEIRRHLFWKIGGVAFASLGEVAPKYSEFNIENIKYTFGGGIRLMVDEVHKTNLRLDFGFGKHTSAIFFGFSEAF
jgi:outer membrane protein assembly factor BamA